MCDERCVAESPGLAFDVQCINCSRHGWTSSDNTLHKWFKIDDTGHFTEAVTNAYTLEFIESPPRTRMNILCDAWEITAHTYENRLIAINEYLQPYGIEYFRLTEAISDQAILQDEPLILLPMGGDLQAIQIPQCVDAIPAGNPHREANLGSLMSDVEKLRNVLMQRDINVRNRPDSRGLKPRQTEVIENVLEQPGSLTIAALPTGYGKTRIAQSIAWALRNNNLGPAVMISPLISLMDDQRSQWAVFSDDVSNSDLHPVNTYKSKFLTQVEDQHPLDMMAELTEGNIDLFCSSPETLMSAPPDRPTWIDTLSKLEKPVSLLIIDEAHIIGDWGASIRPEFQLLSWVKDRLLQSNEDLRVLLMSATISEEEETELIHLFQSGLNLNNSIREPRTRPDLYFHVDLYGKDGQEEAFTKGIEKVYSERAGIDTSWYVHQEHGQHRPPAIVYTPLKTDAEGVIKTTAQEYFIDVRTYTGDTSGSRRESTRLAFIRDEFDCLVATSAFGMGIDKPDVWVTSYFGLPHTLKGLYQGFGRAARESKWESETPTDWSSGICYAVIPDVPPRGFRAQLGLPKTLERLWDLFFDEDTIIVGGYILLPIRSNLERAAWSPHTDVVREVIDAADEDANDDFMCAQNASLAGNDFLQELSKQKRKEKLFNARMWTIACLNRTLSVKFLGIHRKVLFKNRYDHSQKVKLSDVISEAGGYQNVMQLLANPPAGYTLDSSSTQYAVLRFNRYVGGWNDIAELAIEGRDTLHNRHSRGREELSQFIKGVRNGECIRSLFSKAIGGVQEENTCRYFFENNSKSMPCKNCKARYIPGIDQDVFLWSNSDTIETLQWTPPRPGLPEEIDSTDLISESLKRTNLSIYNRDLSTFEGEVPVRPRTFERLNQEHNRRIENSALEIRPGEYELVSNTFDSHGRIIVSNDNRLHVYYVGDSPNEVWDILLFCVHTNICYFW